MPLYYDFTYPSTSNGSGGTEQTQIWSKTVANQESVGIYGFYGSARNSVAGGATQRIKSNTGTTASGGVGTTSPTAKNLRYAVAAQSLWTNAGAAITAGGTLLLRQIVGVAQTGGQGGYIPITPQAAIQMMPNATNPVDLEFTNIATAASVVIDMLVEIGEGI
jgi:hypothetical protein